MRYELLSCHGFEEAMLGAMLSYGKTSLEDLLAYPLVEPDIMNRMFELSKKLAKAGPGHDKFMEQIQYWIAIQAPLYWWKQFDTYRIGVSKSSESTMHKSWKNGLTELMFENAVYPCTIEYLNRDIHRYHVVEDPEIKKQLEKQIVSNLPDGYLQTRMVNTNAKTLKNIYNQRKDHKLTEWREFCDWFKTLPCGELITVEK